MWADSFVGIPFVFLLTIRFSYSLHFVEFPAVSFLLFVIRKQRVTRTHSRGRLVRNVVEIIDGMGWWIGWIGKLGFKSLCLKGQ